MKFLLFQLLSQILLPLTYEELEIAQCTAEISRRLFPVGSSILVTIPAFQLTEDRAILYYNHKNVKYITKRSIQEGVKNCPPNISIIEGIDYQHYTRENIEFIDSRFVRFSDLEWRLSSVSRNTKCTEIQDSIFQNIQCRFHVIYFIYQTF
mgnify:CR=1 FL=1